MAHTTQLMSIGKIAKNNKGKINAKIINTNNAKDICCTNLG